MTEKICSDGACGRAAIARGMCNVHYQRWRRGCGDQFVPLTSSRVGVCIVDEPGYVCEPVHAKGMCNAHYKRWLRYGDPLGLSAEERFRRRVEQAGDCLIFIGTKNRDGYGLMRLGGVTRRAHRVAWMLAYGAIPEGMVVRHRCPAGRRDCVAIEHLAIGTQRDNVRDMMADGTSNKGERNGNAMLTEADIRAIRDDPRGNRDVARDYGVTHSAVSGIRTRKRWAHVA